MVKLVISIIQTFGTFMFKFDWIGITGIPLKVYGPITSSIEVEFLISDESPK